MSTPQKDELRVAVVGAGRMGSDHVDRLAHRTHRARVSAVVDVDLDRASAVAASAVTSGIESPVALPSIAELLEAGTADAVVLATPGFLHEEALLSLLDTGLPVLCEKPLTPDPASALRVVEAEVASGRRLIQVGFMRRFDAGYRRLKETIESGELGELLMLHHQHRNPVAPPEFDDAMIIHDSAVHEFDAVRFFSGEEITEVDVRIGRTSRRATPGLRDPQHLRLRTTSGLLADAEIFVNAQLGYQVHTQATFESGVVRIGEESTMLTTTEHRSSAEVHTGFVERFRDSYDSEVQQWVDATRAEGATGPSAWDGYAAATCCAAGVLSKREERAVAVEMVDQPSFYSRSQEHRMSDVPH